MLTDYYLEEGRREDAIALLKRQAEKTKYNGDIKEKLQSLAGEVQTVSADYDEISTECSGYMYVKSGDLYGFLNSSGQEILRPEYQSVGLFGDWGVAPVQKDGESYYIDTNNYKRRQPEEAYQYLGTEKQGIIPAEKDGKWGYLNRQFQPLTEFIYDAATPILDGFGAVKQGESWALIGDDLQMATDFVFSDVLQDEWGFCSRNGVAFVKSGEQYILVDAEGKQLGSESYEVAYPFVSDQPAAVMQSGKWGFVSIDGSKTLECMFVGAKSFSGIGYAPVQTDDGWGYIKQNGDIAVQPQFEDAKAFNSRGIAPVKTDGSWKLIQLDIY